MDELTKKSMPVDEVHLLDFMVVLAKYSRMIIYITIAAMILIYIYLFIKPNEYTTVARLLPPQQNMTMSAQLLDTLGGGVTPGTVSGGGLGGLGAGLLGLKSPADLYVGMMTGTTISDKMIARFHLLKHYGVKNQEMARKTLGSNTIIKLNKEGLIEISVTEDTPNLAADLANAFVEELDILLQNLAVREAKDRMAFLDKERVLANVNLAKAEETLRKFSEVNSVIQIEAQTKGMLQYIATLRAEIDSKEVQMEVLRKQATPFNYDVVKTETEINGLKQKLQNAEKQWEACVGDVCLPTSKVPFLGLEYMRLYREVKFQETLFALYSKMVEVARLDLVKDVAILQVVDRATPPEIRSNKRALFALLGGIAVFLLMIMVAFGREYYQKAAQSETEAHRLIELSNYAQSWRHDIHSILALLKIKKKKNII